ncbi:MAG: PmoA family protein [Aureliella sp.]
MLSVQRLTFWFGHFLFSSAAFGQALSIEESDRDLSVRQGDRLIVAYKKESPTVPEGIEQVFQRSGCLHPIQTPDGRTITEMFPKDHPHQHGVFTAWVKTKYGDRKPDFWNLARGTGRVLHERILGQTVASGNATFEVNLIHRAAEIPRVDVLRERWTVSVRPTDGSYNCIDIDLKQTAVTDTPLIISQNRYGGFAVRGRSEWLAADDGAQGELPKREKCYMLTDQGADRIDGNHQRCKWVALSGELEGKDATIAVLSHPSNFRAPQSVRLHPTKPYFCFSPCVDGEFRIERDHPYTARYRIVVTDAAPDPEWLDHQWTKWSRDEPD